MCLPNEVIIETLPINLRLPPDLTNFLFMKLPTPCGLILPARCQQCIPHRSLPHLLLVWQFLQPIPHETPLAEAIPPVTLPQTTMPNFFFKRQLQITMLSKITVQRTKTLSVVSSSVCGRHEMWQGRAEGTLRQDRECWANSQRVQSVVMASVCLNVAEEGGRGMRVSLEPWQLWRKVGQFWKEGTVCELSCIHHAWSTLPRCLICLLAE